MVHLLRRAATVASLAWIQHVASAAATEPFALHAYEAPVRRSFSSSPHFAALGSIYSENRLYKRKSYGRAGPMHARGHGEFSGNSPMLRVECQVGTSRLDAFVDTGAQVTVMSLECAQRCGLMSLVDKRFTGNAKGVGSTRIVGRIDGIELVLGPPQRPGGQENDDDEEEEEEDDDEKAKAHLEHRRRERERLQKGGRFFSGRRSLPAQAPARQPEVGQVRLRNARLMILEDLDLDMLIGMDLLRQGDCEICISKNVLRFTQNEDENVSGSTGNEGLVCSDGYDDEKVIVEVPLVEVPKQIKVATVKASHDVAKTPPRPQESSKYARASSAVARPTTAQSSRPSSSGTAAADSDAGSAPSRNVFEYDQYGRPQRSKKHRLPPPPPPLQPYRWTGRQQTSRRAAASVRPRASGHAAPAHRSAPSAGARSSRPYATASSSGRGKAPASYATAAGKRLAEKDFLGRRQRRPQHGGRRDFEPPTPAASSNAPSEPTHLASKLRELRNGNGEDLQGM